MSDQCDNLEFDYTKPEYKFLQNFLLNDVWVITYFVIIAIITLVGAYNAHLLSDYKNYEPLEIAFGAIVILSSFFLPIKNWLYVLTLHARFSVSQ